MIRLSYFSHWWLFLRFWVFASTGFKLNFRFWIFISIHHWILILPTMPRTFAPTVPCNTSFSNNGLQPLFPVFQPVLKQSSTQSPRASWSAGERPENLVPRVFSAFNWKTLGTQQITWSRLGKYANFFKMAARNKVREIWVRQLPTNKMEYEAGNPKL